MITGTLLPALPVMIGEGECTVSSFYGSAGRAQWELHSVTSFLTFCLPMSWFLHQTLLHLHFISIGFFFFGVHVGDVVIGVVG